jgi:hypothetical protein
MIVGEQGMVLQQLFKLMGLLQLALNKILFGMYA